MNLASSIADMDAFYAIPQASDWLALLPILAAHRPTPLGYVRLTPLRITDKINAFVALLSFPSLCACHEDW